VNTRRATYRWMLRDLMADHGLFATTALVPLLASRGIELSASQVHRLVTQEPERLSLPILAALCDIFECTPNELIQVTALSGNTRQMAAGGADHVVDLASTVRPKRARVRPEE
jgi:DNA-binding Xre family transcriptional regulator